MDQELRRLERSAQTGDTESIERLWAAKDRAGASYPVYVVTEQLWEYNDNWMDPTRRQFTKVFRSKESAEAHARSLMRDFLTEPSRDLVSYLGENIETFFASTDDKLVDALKELGCYVEWEYNSFVRCETWEVFWTDQKIVQFSNLLASQLYQVTEVTLK